MLVQQKKQEDDRGSSTQDNTGQRHNSYRPAPLSERWGSSGACLSDTWQGWSYVWLPVVASWLAWVPIANVTSRSPF
jgi:hypothetical protein